MKVNDRSKYITDMAVLWAVVEALLGGTSVMRTKKEYLPQWPQEDDISYKNRLAVATLFPALKRTLSVMTGKPFSKQLTLEEDVPPRLVEYCQDINLEGQNLHVFSVEVFSEAMAFGLCGILVDFPVIDPNAAPRTVAEEKAIGARPYFTFVRHNQLLGWKTSKRNGVPYLEQLRIKEEVEIADGEFGTKCIEQVRVLAPGVWVTYRKNEKDEWLPHENGLTTLSIIPFVPFYGTRLGFMEGVSPLQDLAYLNVKHWQSQSDQDTILHIARVPILVTIGAEPLETGDGAQTVSASSRINIPMGGDMKYVEHGGAAIEAGQTSLEKLEEQMIQTGAELLVSKPGAVRTATESSQDAEGNKSDLQRIVEGFEDSMDQALQIMAMWVQEAQGGHISLFKDFGAFNLTDASAQLILSMQQGGLITRETALMEFKRRGVLHPDLIESDELEKVDEEGPRLAALWSTPPEEGGEGDPALQ